MRTGLTVLTVLGVLIPATSVAKGRPEPPSCPDDVATAIAVECPCDGQTETGGETPVWRNHGRYVRCVNKYVNQLRRSGCVTLGEKHTVRRCAARSTCGKAGRVLCCVPRTNTCSDPLPDDALAEGVCENDPSMTCNSDARCATIKMRIARSEAMCMEAGGEVFGTGSVCSDCPDQTASTTTSTTSTSTTTTSSTTTTTFNTTTTKVPIMSAVRGSITAPNGVPQINPNCGVEIFVVGSDWWGMNACWDQVRGIMEFDVSPFLSSPFQRVVLSLQDTGSTSSGEPQRTHLLGYSGDGVLTPGDWGVPASLVATVTRPNVAGTTTHDVTAFVKARLSAGAAFVGFRLEPADPSTFDAFGFFGLLTFE